MPAGRPTEYEAERIAKAVTAYIKECDRKLYLPTIEGLAVHLEVRRETLYDWANPKSDRYHEEFSDIFDALRAKQAAQLIQNGLANNYNSTITKLMLTKHGYTDKQETDITTGGKEINQVLVKFIDGKDNRDTEGVS